MLVQAICKTLLMRVVFFFAGNFNCPAVRCANNVTISLFTLNTATIVFATVVVIIAISVTAVVAARSSQGFDEILYLSF